jgi:hypothetical protein
VLTAIDPLSDEKLAVTARKQVEKAADEGADVIKVFASQSTRTGGGPGPRRRSRWTICAEGQRSATCAWRCTRTPGAAAGEGRAASSIEHGAPHRPACSRPDGGARHLLLTPTRTSSSATISRM